MEISITVQDRDRQQAALRAQLFEAATGETVHPFVVGEREEPPGPDTPGTTFLQYEEP